MSNSIDAILADNPGASIKVLAERYKEYSYQQIYLRAKSTGALVGRVHVADKRPWMEKVRDFIRPEPHGCLRWIGKPGKVHLTGSMSTADAIGWAARFYGRRSLGGGRSIVTCGNEWCVNPDHRGNTCLFTRDAEVVERWRLHIQHSTSMPELAKEFGLTKQRVEQIIRSARLPYVRPAKGRSLP